MMHLMRLQYRLILYLLNEHDKAVIRSNSTLSFGINLNKIENHLQACNNSKNKKQMWSSIRYDE